MRTRTKDKGQIRKTPEEEKDKGGQREKRMRREERSLMARRTRGGRRQEGKEMREGNTCFLHRWGVRVWLDEHGERRECVPL